MTRLIDFAIVALGASLLAPAGLGWINSPAHAQSDDEELISRALNNVQHEMSQCVAYQMIVAECVKSRSPELAAQYDQVAEHLFRSAFSIGAEIGMSEDAMMSRVMMERVDMQELAKGSCINMSSLFSRYGLRCKQVVEDSDAIFLEYLGQAVKGK